MKHVNTGPPLLRAAPNPTELDQIVLRALAKDPGDHYQSAEEFIEDLERFEAGLPISRATSTAATALLAGAASGEATELLSESPTRVVAPSPPPPRPDARAPTRRRARTTSLRSGAALGALAPGRAPDRRRRARGLVGVQPDPGAARGERPSACRSSRDCSEEHAVELIEDSRTRGRDRGAAEHDEEEGSSSSRTRRRARRSQRGARHDHGRSGPRQVTFLGSSAHLRGGGRRPERGRPRAPPRRRLLAEAASAR